MPYYAVTTADPARSANAVYLPATRRWSVAIIDEANKRDHPLMEVAVKGFPAAMSLMNTTVGTWGIPARARTHR